VSQSSSKTLIAVPSERPKSAGDPCLVIIQGDEIGRRVDLSGAVVEIGRSPEATITIDSELVSRRHATVMRIAGKFIVSDLKSTNGTFVNGEKVGTHALQDGDKIRIGKTVIKYMESNLELQYHEQLYNLAAVDSLTGIFNKRHFDETLKKEVLRCAQSNTPLSLVVLDIDFFKRINDTHGHPAGDEVLRTLSATLKSKLTPDDCLARVGGEEFALLFPGYRCADASRRAEDLRCLVEASACDYEGTAIPVTVSMGVAEFAGAAETPLQLYQRADAQLYEAKRTGRNRVCRG
jgi:diguanylate cyclase (GGDEF)-like protein